MAALERSSVLGSHVKLDDDRQRVVDNVQTQLQICRPYISPRETSRTRGTEFEHIHIIVLCRMHSGVSSKHNIINTVIFGSNQMHQEWSVVTTFTINLVCSSASTEIPRLSLVGLEHNSTIELVMAALGRSSVLRSIVKLDEDMQGVVDNVVAQTSTLPSLSLTERNVSPV